MLDKIKNRKQEGFTIIEVLIVLAIAGLILLIVFLAVPALQRNSRNTQRKTDVSAILGAVAEYGNNNNGVLPVSTTPPTNTGGVVTFNAPAGLTPSQARVAFYNTGIGTAPGNIVLAPAGTTTLGNTLDSAPEDFVRIAAGTTCNGNASVAGPSRSVTAVYEIETGNGAYAQACQSS